MLLQTATISTKSVRRKNVNTGFTHENQGRNQLTLRNFFKSLPVPISRKTTKARLTSDLIAEAASRTHSSGITTCGMCSGDLVGKISRPNGIIKIEDIMFY